jgi:preprotein translocase subunit SecB
MVPKASPLHIVDFAFTELEFGLVSPLDIEDDITPFFKQYEINIDFGVLEDEFLKVFMRAEINKGENKLPGYSMLAEVACIFNIDKDSELPDNVRSNLEGFSTIYIALNSLRGLISSFTANCPFGRYMLPSIDLNDLIDKKKAVIKAAHKEQEPKKINVDKAKTKQKKHSS